MKTLFWKGRRVHLGERIVQVEGRSRKVRAILDLGDNDRSACLLRPLIADIEALIREVYGAPWSHKKRERVSADLEGTLEWAEAALESIRVVRGKSLPERTL